MKDLNVTPEMSKLLGENILTSRRHKQQSSEQESNSIVNNSKNWKIRILWSLKDSTQLKKQPGEWKGSYIAKICKLYIV